MIAWLYYSGFAVLLLVRVNNYSDISIIFVDIADLLTKVITTVVIFVQTTTKMIQWETCQLNFRQLFLNVIYVMRQVHPKVAYKSTESYITK